MAIMNENKGVFGLNMLHWWDREGSLDRVVEPLVDDLAAGRLEPVVAASFPFDRRAPRRTASSTSAATSARSSSCRDGRCRRGVDRQLLRRAHRRRRKLPAFIYLIFFLGTFAFIRTSAHMIRAQVSWWPGNVEVGGTHIHHLVWGILLLMIAGWIGIVVAP